MTNVAKPVVTCLLVDDREENLVALVVVGVVLLGALCQRYVIILTTCLTNVKKISPAAACLHLLRVDIFKSGIVAVRHVSHFSFTKLNL